MKKYYSFRIPSPCQEDWHEMTPTEKGRFCDACSKTVIDFTAMNQNEIRDFLAENHGKKICGHVKKSQLDNIHIKIPVELIRHNRFGHRSFLWALLFAMGTTLLSCKDKQGNIQKIDRIEVIDSLINDTEEVPVTGKINPPISCSPLDSVQPSLIEQKHTEDPPTDEVVLDGEILVGQLVVASSNDEPAHISMVEQPPEFPNTPKHLTAIEKRHYFQKALSQHFETHTNYDINTQMDGILRVYTRFVINEKGSIEDVQIRAQHPLLREEVRRVISLLPEFVPAKNRGENIAILIALPVTFGDK